MIPKKPRTKDPNAPLEAYFIIVARTVAIFSISIQFLVHNPLIVRSGYCLVYFFDVCFIFVGNQG